MGKRCSKCGLSKPEEMFQRKIFRDGTIGLRGYCRECRNEYEKGWREKNLEKERAKSRGWKMRQKMGVPRPIPKTPMSDSERRAARKRRRSMMMLNPQYRLNGSMSSAVNRCLGGAKASRRWESLVGFSWGKLKQHLERQFTPGMTWQNYGSYWHVDHKIPVAAFNFQTPGDIDFKRCWSLKNLQPLESRKNESKGARTDKPFQPALMLTA